MIARAALILMQSVVLLLLDRNIVSGQEMLESIDTVCTAWERATTTTEGDIANSAARLVRNFRDSLEAMMTT
jgi:hypothetical protein